MSKQDENWTPDSSQPHQATVSNADVGAAWLSLLLLAVIALIIG